MVCQLQCERTREKISFDPFSENGKSGLWDLRNLDASGPSVWWWLHFR